MEASAAFAPPDSIDESVASQGTTTSESSTMVGTTTEAGMAERSSSGRLEKAASSVEGDPKANMVISAKAPNYEDRLSNELWIMVFEELVFPPCQITSTCLTILGPGRISPFGISQV
jgi:hypothetical protein